MEDIDTNNSELYPDDPKEAILEIVEKKRIIRREDLITSLAGKKKKVGKMYRREGGQFGQATVNRHIKALIDLNQIKLIAYPECTQYGITDEAENATYVILSSDSKQAKHYNAVLAGLASKDIVKKKNSLTEIEHLGEIRLIPKQLDILSDTLNNDDVEVCYQAARVLHEHIMKFVFPLDVKKLRKNLITCYKKFYASDHQRSFNLRQYIIYQLAILDDPIVIDFLKQDIRDSNNNPPFGNIYSQWQVAKLIHEHRTELLEFSNTLPQEKSSTVFTIRKEAIQNLPTYRVKIKDFKEKLRTTANKHETPPA